MVSSATMPAAAIEPACRILPPTMRRNGRARSMKSLLPHSTEPIGADNPFETQKHTESVWRAMSAAVTPSATAALNSRAPSVCTGMP